MAAWLMVAGWPGGHGYNAQRPGSGPHAEISHCQVKAGQDLDSLSAKLWFGECGDHTAQLQGWVREQQFTYCKTEDCHRTDMLELFTRSEDCNTDLCMKMASSNLLMATETFITTTQLVSHCLFRWSVRDCLWKRKWLHNYRIENIWFTMWPYTT